MIKTNLCGILGIELPIIQAPIVRNSTVEKWERAGCPAKGERPNEGETVGYSITGEAILRYSDTIPLPQMQGDAEALALYAGQTVGLINKLNTSSEIIAQLLEEIEVTYESLKKQFMTS